jgi:hypothetical protein
MYLRFEFFADGTYESSNSNGENINGNYSVDGNIVALGNISNRSIFIDSNNCITMRSPNGDTRLKRI